MFIFLYAMSLYIGTPSTASVTSSSILSLSLSLVPLTTMAPHLRILAGPHPGDMQDITSTVNSGKSHTISSGLFEGEIALFIQDFPSGEQKPSEGDAATKYFSSPERKGVTWSLQSRGITFSDVYAVITNAKASQAVSCSPTISTVFYSGTHSTNLSTSRGDLGPH
jgi:hypothetical protein